MKNKAIRKVIIVIAFVFLITGLALVLFPPISSYF